MSTSYILMWKYITKLLKILKSGTFWNVYCANYRGLETRALVSRTPIILYYTKIGNWTELRAQTRKILNKKLIFWFIWLNKYYYNIVIKTIKTYKIAQNYTDHTTRLTSVTPIGQLGLSPFPKSVVRDLGDGRYRTGTAADKGRIKTRLRSRWILFWSFRNLPKLNLRLSVLLLAWIIIFIDFYGFIVLRLFLEYCFWHTVSPGHNMLTESAYFLLL